MKGRIGTALAIGLILAGASIATASPPQGKGKKPKANQGEVVQTSSVGVHVVFGSGEVAILRSHYASRYANLPPGLQKKVARGRALPPGWQKKFEPFPAGIERQLQPLPAGYRRGVIDGHAVIYNSRSSVVVDLAVLF